MRQLLLLRLVWLIGSCAFTVAQPLPIDFPPVPEVFGPLPAMEAAPPLTSLVFPPLQSLVTVPVAETLPPPSLPAAAPAAAAAASPTVFASGPQRGYAPRGIIRVANGTFVDNTCREYTISGWNQCGLHTIEVPRRGAVLDPN